jgi:hypothetical protein
VDQDDLFGPQQSLRDQKGADGILGRHAPGVANDMGIALLQAQDFADDEARIHAGQDCDLPAGGHRQPALVEGSDVAGVVL